MQGTQQDFCVGNGFVGMGKADATGIGQLCHFRQFFTLEADGQRAKRIDVRLVSGGSTIFEHFDESRFVQYRVGIRRADQTGDTAGDGGLHFGFQGGLVFVSRLTEASRQIDKSGCDDQSAGINGSVRSEAGYRLAGFGNGENFSVGNGDASDAVGLAGRIDQTSVFDKKFHVGLSSKLSGCQLPARMLMTAILTAMP